MKDRIERLQSKQADRIDSTRQESMAQAQAEDAMDAYVKEVERVHKRRIRITKGIQYLAVVLVCAAILLVKSKESEAGSRENLADQIIRFHVLANSDSKEDQALKLKVKDRVVEYVQKLLENCTSKKEAEVSIREAMDDITAVARQVIVKEGYQYSVDTRLEQQYFPVKVYGKQIYPEGEYEALRVLIGRAEGKNWWCVMFPGLCMVEETYFVDAEVEGSEETTDNVESENDVEEEKDVETVYRFWIFDWLNDLF